MPAGRIGIIDSAENTGGKPSRLSEDESANGQYLERSLRTARQSRGSASCPREGGA